MFRFTVSQFPSMPANCQAILINGFDIPLIKIWNVTGQGDQPSGIRTKDHMEQNYRSIPHRH